MLSMALIWADGGSAEVLPLEGESYRTRGRRDLLETTTPTNLCQAQSVQFSHDVDRRLARDSERLPEAFEAFVKWSMIGLMTRRLAPAKGRRP